MDIVVDIGIDIDIDTDAETNTDTHAHVCVCACVHCVRCTDAVTKIDIRDTGLQIEMHTEMNINRHVGLWLLVRDKQMHPGRWLS